MKILIALDESETSAHAASVAGQLFTPCRAEFTVINVTRIPTPWVGGAAYGAVAPVPSDPAWLEPGDTQRLNLMDRAERSGVADAEAVVDAGDPVDLICAAAHEHGIDIIVVGSHERSALRRIFDPSVATGIMHRTNLPVLVVPGLE